MKRTVRFYIPLLLSFFLGCNNGLQPGKNESASQQSKDKKTILVYMAADNDLESYALQNLKQMEKAVFKKTTVLVLLDRAAGYDRTDGDWTDTRLFEVKHDKSNSAAIVSKRLECSELGLTLENETELDMGNPQVLSGFITYAKRKYAADNYILIIWGHGTGWRFSEKSEGRAVAVDDTSDSFMTVKELGAALKNKELNLIGFDTCFGGIFENVYELKECSNYIVASPDITPSVGWNYTQLLENISVCESDDFVMAQTMAESSSVNTTIIENGKLNDVMAAIETFSKQLADSITTSQKRDEVFGTLFAVKSYCYSQYPCDMYLDLYEMADVYKSAENETLVQNAIALQNVLTSCGETKGSQNIQLGIHFIPKTSAQTIATQHASDYIKKTENTTQCAFIKESLWWVPTESGTSGSLLDKLFYTVF